MTGFKIIRSAGSIEADKYEKDFAEFAVEYIKMFSLEDSVKIKNVLSNAIMFGFVRGFNQRDSQEKSR